MRFIQPPVYTPPVNYKQEYFTKFAPHMIDPREVMRENCEYAIKIANHLYNSGNYSSAIHYYEEAIKLGGNTKMLNLEINRCKRYIDVVFNIDKKRKPGL
jgi:hypothetical protein